ncbi:MAG: hypothetical protein IAE82_04400 [Opitutaceae bacterium]|nr:hypothetical protein [Opitutaceae bacterium]
MNRATSLLAGPELVLALLTGAVFWFCARHDSGEGRDVQLCEKLLMLLPLFVVPAAFATVLLPGAKTWWWLGRAVVFTYVFMLVCAGRLIAGFGTGAKGQDAAFIMVLMFGTVLIAIGTAVTGALVLAENRPAFAAWFGARKILGSFLTAVATVPIGFGLGILATIAVTVVASLATAFKR